MLHRLMAVLIVCSFMKLTPNILLLCVVLQHAQAQACPEAQPRLEHTSHGWSIPAPAQQERCRGSLLAGCPSAQLHGVLSAISPTTIISVSASACAVPR